MLAVSTSINCYCNNMETQMNFLPKELSFNQITSTILKSNIALKKWVKLTQFTNCRMFLPLSSTAHFQYMQNWGCIMQLVMCQHFTADSISEAIKHDSNTQYTYNTRQYA